MEILIYILIGVAVYALVSAHLTYKLWVHYLAVMSLARAQSAGQLTTLTYRMGMYTLFKGLILDFVVNVFVMTFILWELPREMTVTARLKRHNQKSPLNSWGKRVAMWFEPVLDPFDPKGDHI